MIAQLNTMLSCIINFPIKRIIILFMLFTQNSYSQQNYLFDHIGFETGLPDLFTPIDLVQDHLGFLWITSFNSLIKYDGYSMKIYHNIKDPTANNSLFIDRDSILWVGTSNGLSMYQREKDTFINYDFYREGFFIFDYRTRTIQEDKNGLLWICSYYSGLYSFDKNTKEVKAYKHDKENPNSISTDTLNGIVIDDNNKLWINTVSNGIEKFDIDSKQFTHYTFNEKDSNSIGSNYTRTMYKEKSGNILIVLDNNRFDELNPETGQFNHFRLDTESEMSAIYKDEYGFLWIASGLSGNGITLFDKNRKVYSYIKHDPLDTISLKE